jgi:hypothetical protein
VKWGWREGGAHFLSLITNRERKDEDKTVATIQVKRHESRGTLAEGMNGMSGLKLWVHSFPDPTLAYQYVR